MLRFSNFLRHFIIYFRIFFYSETCFLKLLFRCYADYKPYHRYMVQFIPIKLVKEEIARPCDRHGIETVTLRKHITNIKTCENRRSNFSENLRTVQLKLVEITRFLSPKSIDSKLFTVLGVRCDDTFKLTGSAQSIYWEVYD